MCRTYGADKDKAADVTDSVSIVPPGLTVFACECEPFPALRPPAAAGSCVPG